MKKYPIISKITMVINKQLSKSVINALNKIGVYNLYIEAGRISILKENRGLTILMNKVNLEYVPVELISFYIPKQFEEDMMSYIYSEFDYKTPGRGTLISQDISLIKAHPLCEENTDLDIPEAKKAVLFKELKGICCVVQRGEEDKIAKAALDLGTSVPITTYGEGSGVRDKLGLLRITISQEKALINLVISAYDIDSVMELFITEGKLQEPGRGIAYVYDIKQGVINTKISKGKSGEVASLEQVVYALDSIKGGMGWRKSRLDYESYRKRPFLNNLIELTLVCNEGMGTYLATIAMEHGAPGATIYKTKYNSISEDDNLPAAREICKMILSYELIPAVVESIESAGGFEESSQGLLYSLPVSKAFTYIGANK